MITAALAGDRTIELRIFWNGGFVTPEKELEWTELACKILNRYQSQLVR